MRLLKYLEQANSIAFVIGRFNPPHKGHLELIQHARKKYEAVFVVVVYGTTASQNSERNPLPQGEIVNILSKIVPSDVNFLETMTAYFPDFLSDEAKSKLEGKKLTIICGPDRFDAYKDMAKSIDKNFGSNMSVEYVDFNRDKISSTFIRQLMRNKNYEEAQEYLPYSVDLIKRYF